LRHAAALVVDRVGSHGAGQGQGCKQPQQCQNEPGEAGSCEGGTPNGGPNHDARSLAIFTVVLQKVYQEGGYECLGAALTPTRWFPGVWR